MKYELGAMDVYPILANRTVIENNPFLEATLKETIDEKRLKVAVKKAMIDHPLFGCTIQYKGRYYLETNEADVVLTRTSQEERPLEFGDRTNGYPWQICFDNHRISLEWCHGISDGRGGYDFFASILSYYFDVYKEVLPDFQPGLERFYDKKEQGIPQKKQEKGFQAKDLPYIKRGYEADCHILTAPMSQLLVTSKKSDSSPAAVMAPLFSKALRKYIKKDAKNKNVVCNVVVDCRKPMGVSAMHNCIIPKNITYVDRYDTMDFALVSTIYRTILDLAVARENIVHAATETVDMIRPLIKIKPRCLQRVVGKIAAGAMKHGDSNFTFTYLGKVDFPEPVMEGLEGFQFRSWTDIGECNIAAIDFKGTLVLNLCENYVDKGIVDEFVKECADEGIFLERKESFLFHQANYRKK